MHEHLRLTLVRHREYWFVNGLLHRRRVGKVDIEEANVVSTASPPNVIEKNEMAG